MGNTDEVSGSAVTKYYFAGGQLVGMRQGGTLNYLLSDHLGSTSITTDASGNRVAELRYKAWGETRYSWQTTPTRYTFQGQYSNVSDFGLQYFNARWYDGYLNHFTQPDAIVPDQYNPQDWDRYAFARNNPLRYTDPTGHWSTTVSFNLSNLFAVPLNLVFGAGANQRAAQLVDSISTTLDAGALLVDSAIVAADFAAGAIGFSEGAAVAVPGAEAPVVVTGPLGAAVGVAMAETAAKPALFLGNLLATGATVTTAFSDILTGDTNYTGSLTVGSSTLAYDEQLVLGPDTYTSAGLTAVGWTLPYGFISWPVQAMAVVNDTGVLHESGVVEKPPPVPIIDRHISLNWN